MSDTTPTEAPPAAAATTPGTHYDIVKQMAEAKASREDMLAKLKASGLDDESAKVLINSVTGAMPQELPDAQLSPGMNVLSPSTFTLSDIGLTGHPATVGLYWMGFGAAILLALGVGTMLTVMTDAKLPEDVGYYAFRLGGVISMTCVAWGLFRYFQGVTIKRKQ